MSNNNQTRLSPAELRRRLLSPPTDAAPPSIPSEEEAPPLLPRRIRSEGSRFGGMASQMGIDLNNLAEEVVPEALAKITPIPDSRLNQTQFRSREGSIPFAQPAPTVPMLHGSDHDLLRAQNAELSRLIDEMRPLLEEATAQENRFQIKEQEFAAHLGEKDRQLLEMAAKLKQVEEELANVPPPKTPKTRDELEEWNDELEQESAKLTQERRRLDEDRRQLRDDEESLEKQMRDMECSMAKERAMMARQETELKRLSAEIQHELDLLQRGDGTLREQLSKFQRRHQEVLSRSGGPPMGGPPVGAAPAEPPIASPVQDSKETGIFRRIFRGDK
jgi:hypothetical protein